MTAYDSIVNVEEWISDHYLASDAGKEDFLKQVKARVKEFKTFDPNPLDAVTSRRQDIQARLSTLNTDNADDVQEANQALKQLFGYGPASRHVYHRNNDVLETEVWRGAQGSVLVVESKAIDSPDDLADVQPVAASTLNEKDYEPTTSELLSHLFLSDESPEFIVVFAGHWAVLATRESYPLGRLLAVDLSLVFDRGETKSGGEIEHALVILHRFNTERAADGTTWWAQTLEDSHQHAVQVSEDLREAIKDSIEIIGNDVLRRREQQGLGIERVDGDQLARQALRYLYRILFLLFAEASPETEILPVGDPDYGEGYGLARLREAALSEPTSQRAQTGTHLYESLALLFRLVDQGHNPIADADELDEHLTQGLTFQNMSADLFKPKATSLIDEVGLSNAAMQKVLEHLLLSRATKNKARGFISYATLGVSELGQVYEGLMSYKGFIATERLWEVASRGDNSKGSWVVPERLINDLPDDSFVMTTTDAPGGGTMQTRKYYQRGEFVFRQSSRDRERSASFYTPQVLTEFTVSQAIEVLEEQGRLGTADDVLSLTICEPAMGSGAFAVEAVAQLAEKYLTLREHELGQTVAPEDRPREIQRIKAHIAIHQVYGVDLNETAVELAEISLWLSTMTAGLQAPWFGLRLRRGNSLIGCLRSTYSSQQLKKKAWLKAQPRRESVANMAEAIAGNHADPKVADRVHQFLLPSSGWGSAADAKDLKKLSGDEQKQLRSWRGAMTASLSQAEEKRVKDLARRVEELWQFALRRMQIAEQQSSRPIEFFGHEPDWSVGAVTREEIEKDLFDDADGAYRRLRLAMDIWCAFWFWPLTKVDEAPTREEWLDALAAIVGVHGKDHPNADQARIASGMDWHELGVAETANWQFAGAQSMEKVLTDFPWLNTVCEIAKEQDFLHWDLDFAAVFAKGGFDLQVGNPPWVRPTTDSRALLSEFDPWHSLASNVSQATRREREAKTLANPDAYAVYEKGIAESVVTSAVLGDVTQYPFLDRQQPDLYRGFLNRTWDNQDDNGVVGLIHPISHLTEAKAAPLRRGSFLRLDRMWQFINELMLFDVHDLVKYSVCCYSAENNEPNFLMATSLYRPQTVQESLAHDGSGDLPGFKDDDDNWDLRPHKDRILHVDEDQLKLWHSILEDDNVALYDTRVVFSVNTDAEAVLRKLANAPRMRSLGLHFSAGWHESGDKRRGYFDQSWQHPDSWDDVILQGPHLGVATPMIKQPNPTMKHNQDWSEIDFEWVPSDFIPATSYAPDRGQQPNYDTDYGTWEVDGEQVLVKDTFRVAWRRMAANTGFRTLYPAITPPGTTHIDGVSSMGPISKSSIIGPAISASLLLDFYLRSIAIANIRQSSYENLPLGTENALWPILSRHYLRLNCLTEAYAPLWEEITGEEWTMDTPIRNAAERRQALNEIDAMVALSLGVTADELCMIYRTQFPVMRKYDTQDHFDANGRPVPKEVLDREKKAKVKGQLNQEDRTWTHPQSQVTYVFVYPFTVLDREADLRAAYAKYEEMI